ncbi:hypothetical protein EX30DRAFT_371875 [Ascodesmis nigricans]|uniref:Uncharacterized protein n=1 Tax=Ascodesmis nigricans TaxID=341454 RepID=A0A4S2MW26_9PEZI|nr:hypothetical protein EX30DRAFT_371875 [Ascodesmis nigricans]
MSKNHRFPSFAKEPHFHNLLLETRKNLLALFDWEVQLQRDMTRLEPLYFGTMLADLERLKAGLDQCSAELTWQFLDRSAGSMDDGIFATLVQEVENVRRGMRSGTPSRYFVRDHSTDPTILDEEVDYGYNLIMKPKGPDSQTFNLTRLGYKFQWDFFKDLLQNLMRQPIDEAGFRNSVRDPNLSTISTDSTSTSFASAGSASSSAKHTPHFSIDSTGSGAKIPASGDKSRGSDEQQRGHSRHSSHNSNRSSHEDPHRHVRFSNDFNVHSAIEHGGPRAAPHYHDYIQEMKAGSTVSTILLPAAPRQSQADREEERVRKRRDSFRADRKKHLN